MKKSLIAIFATIVMLLSMMTPLLSTVQAQGAEPASNYTTSYGVLSTDSYVMYPFAAQSLAVGFSKYGELIGINSTADMTVQGNWVGLKYDGRDPFCPADTVPMTSWINGWYMMISYIDPTMSTLGKADRVLYAAAMFSDGSVWGGDWQSVTGPTTGVGGRQTNGSVTTDPLKVLYDGPREFVAQSVNHISDKQGTVVWPVVDLTITMIFNKVMKQVTLLKDTKITIPKMHIWGKLNVQLSNREEYDLGPSPTYDSYAHYYRAMGDTSYTGNTNYNDPWYQGTWHTASDLTADHWETQTVPATSPKQVFILNTPGNLPLSPDFIKIYIGGVFVDPTVTPAPYTVNYATKNVTFATPQSGTIKFLYKYVFASTYRAGVPAWDNLYDYAQVISSDGRYVAWTGIWPMASSYTVDGILDFLRPLYDTQINDMSTEPKESPLIIGQWDFALDHSSLPMYRCVEVKGVSDRHDGDDANAYVQSWSSGYNILDCEAKYQLDSVFLPWDLAQSVEDKLNTWVQYYTVTATDMAYIKLGYSLLIDLAHSPVHFADNWEAYNSQSERVFINGMLQYPFRQIDTVGMYWTYELLPDYYSQGKGAIVIVDTSGLTVGTVIKIVYATDVVYDMMPFTLSGTTQTVAGTTTSTVGYYDQYIDQSWIDPLNVEHEVYTDSADYGGYDWTFTPLATAPTANITWTYSFPNVLEFTHDPFKMYKEDSSSFEIGDDAPVTLGGGTTGAPAITTLNLEVNWYMKYMPEDSSLFNEWLDVQVTGWDFDLTYSYTVTYNTHWANYTITPHIGFITEYHPYLFEEKIPGRYEFGVVGTQAASVDSAGLSMITAAFKDKQVEYGIGAEDMFDTNLANQIPWVMSRRDAITPVTKSDYYYSATPVLPQDWRTGLRDDHCTTWQITSANLIGSGGPYANLLAWYDNDFESAFYGIPQFTTYAPWSGKIAPLTCWNGTKKGFADTNTTGYAVISTAMDLNGTQIFMVWGNWGRDTFYASQWFWQDGILEFQGYPWANYGYANPFVGATSVVLKISYDSSNKPTLYTVQEILGTISETTTWNYFTGAQKGGIHDP